MAEKKKVPSVEELMALEAEANAASVPTVEELMALEAEAGADPTSGLEKAETVARGAAQSASLGLSEPAITAGVAAAKSGLLDPSFLMNPVQGAFQAGAKYLMGDDSDKALAQQEYQKELERRAYLKEQLPGYDLLGQVGGAFTPLGPAAAVFKGARALTGASKALPQAANVGEKILKFGQEVGAAGLASGGQVAAEKAVGETFGTSAPEADVIETAKQGALFDAGLRGLFKIPAAAKKAGPMVMRSLLGASEEAVQNYRKFGAEADKVYNELGKEGLYQLVQENVNKLSDDVAKARINADEAQKIFDELESRVVQSVRDKKYDVKTDILDAKQRLAETIRLKKDELATIKTQLPQEGLQEIKRGVELIRERVVTGKKQALDALEKSGKSLSLKALIPAIDEAIDSFKIAGKAPISQSSVAAMNRIEGVKNRLNQLKDSVSAKDARKIVDQLDDDINYSKSLVSFNSAEDRALTAIRRAIDKEIKSKVKPFAEQMEAVADDAEFLDLIKNKLGDESKIVSTLVRSLESNKFLDREMLQMLEQKAGVNIIDRVKRGLEAKGALGMDSGEFAKKFAPTESSRLSELEARQANMQDPRYEKFVREEMINSSPKALRVSDTQTQLKVAEDLLKPFKSWSGRTTESNVNAYLNGNSPAVRDLFQYLSSVTNDDLYRKMELFRISNAFEKSFTNGSRNVNTWGAIGSGLASSLVNLKTGALASIGLTSLGPFGLILGVLTGALVDVYGPNMAKKILQGMSMIEGLPTIKKIQKIGQFIGEPEVEQYLMKSFVDSFGELKSDDSPILIQPENIPQVSKDVSDSGLSNIEKAKTMMRLNKDSELINVKKIMFGSEKPKPKQFNPEPKKQEFQPKSIREMSDLIKSRRKQDF